MLYDYTTDCQETNTVIHLTICIHGCPRFAMTLFMKIQGTGCVWSCQDFTAYGITDWHASVHETPYWCVCLTVKDVLSTRKSLATLVVTRDFLFPSWFYFTGHLTESS